MPAVNLTPKDLELLCAVIKHMKAEIDWAAVAETANCKTSKYARDRFTIVRNKLFTSADGEGDQDGDAAAKGQPTTPTSEKTKRKTTGNGDDGTPSKKKPKKSKAETAAKAKRDSPVDGMGDEDDKRDAVKEEQSETEEMAF